MIRSDYYGIISNVIFLKTYINQNYPDFFNGILKYKFVLCQNRAFKIINIVYACTFFRRRKTKPIRPNPADSMPYTLGSGTGVNRNARDCHLELYP